MGTTSSYRATGARASRVNGRRRAVPGMAVTPAPLRTPSIETVLEVAGHLSRSELAGHQFAEWLENQGPVDPVHLERQMAGARQFREWLLHRAWHDA